VDSLNREERTALDYVGADIEILALVPGRSTTKTIQRMALSETPNVEPDEPKKLRLAVLGSGQGSNFKALLSAINDGKLQAEVACVISDVATSGIMKLAEAADVPHFHVDPGTDAKRFPASAQKEVLEHLQRAQADLVLLLGFMRILRGEVLTAYADRVWNLHPSLLPAYPGSNAVQRAIDEGEFETGTTLHVVTAEVDAGRIPRAHRDRRRRKDRARTHQARRAHPAPGPASEAPVAADVRRLTPPLRRRPTPAPPPK
jgi:formyltetrahydrofolate-dependent phosphoribosylglycinamide formyltransferase